MAQKILHGGVFKDANDHVHDFTFTFTRCKSSRNRHRISFRDSEGHSFGYLGVGLRKIDNVTFDHHLREQWDEYLNEKGNWNIKYAQRGRAKMIACLFREWRRQNDAEEPRVERRVTELGKPVNVIHVAGEDSSDEDEDEDDVRQYQGDIPEIALGGKMKSKIKDPKEEKLNDLGAIPRFDMSTEDDPIILQDEGENVYYFHEADFEITKIVDHGGRPVFGSDSEVLLIKETKQKRRAGFIDLTEDYLPSIKKEKVQYPMSPISPEHLRYRGYRSRSPSVVRRKPNANARSRSRSLSPESSPSPALRFLDLSSRRFSPPRLISSDRLSESPESEERHPSVELARQRTPFEAVRAVWKGFPNSTSKRFEKTKHQNLVSG